MRADDLRHCGGKGDHVMPYLGRNLVNALHAEVSTLADGPGRILGHNASLSQRFSRRHFDGKPGAKSVFVVPNAAHFRAGITWNHRITILLGLWILNGLRLSVPAQHQYIVLRYIMKPQLLPPLDFESLAEVRYQIRRFLRFSEAAARAVGVGPH